MNERIKQLAIESKLIVPEYNGFDHTRLSISQQKFAQLIVQKCADIGEQYADGNYEVYNSIMEYFGMQETEE